MRFISYLSKLSLGMNDMWCFCCFKRNVRIRSWPFHWLKSMFVLIKCWWNRFYWSWIVYIIIITGLRLSYEWLCWLFFVWYQFSIFSHGIFKINVKMDFAWPIFDLDVKKFKGPNSKNSRAFLEFKIQKSDMISIC